MTTNQDQTIYVTENKQEFLPEVGQECEIFDPYGNAAKVELLAIKGGKAAVWNDAVGFAETTELEWLRPIRTEAEIKRQEQIEYLFQDIYDIDTSDMRYLAEKIHDKGYIKPIEVTDGQIDKFTQEFDGDLDLSSFDMGARWAEKHIKGEA